VLLYEAGLGAQRIAAHLGCVPATAVRVARRFLELGEDGLLDGRRGNGELKVDEDLRQALGELVAGSAKDHGWTRSTWTREALARTLRRRTGVEVSVTTVARMLHLRREATRLRQSQSARRRYSRHARLAA
jgi:transposase